MNKITKISGEPVKYEILNEQNHQISGEPVKYEILKHLKYLIIDEKIKTCM